MVSDKFIVRLTEMVLDRADSEYDLEVFEPDPSTCLSPPQFGMVGEKSLFRTHIRDDLAHISEMTAFLSRDTFSACESDLITIMLSADRY